MYGHLPPLQSRRRLRSCDANVSMSMILTLFCVFVCRRVGAVLMSLKTILSDTFFWVFSPRGICWSKAHWIVHHHLRRQLLANDHSSVVLVFPIGSICDQFPSVLHRQHRQLVHFWAVVVDACCLHNSLLLWVRVMWCEVTVSKHMLE